MNTVRLRVRRKGDIVRMESKTCCVTVHREIDPRREEQISRMLRDEIEQAVADGFTHFISGFATGADLIFAEAVIALKSKYPITLEAALPYPGRMQSRDPQFRRCLAACDVVKVHADTYFKGCYMIRNRYMVDRSDRVIAVYDGVSRGGTYNTVRYAEGKDVRFVWC